MWQCYITKTNKKHNNPNLSWLLSSFVAHLLDLRLLSFPDAPSLYLCDDEYVPSLRGCCED